MPTPVAAIDIRRDLVGLLPKLRRFAVTLTGDLAEADELVQSVCQRGIAGSISGTMTAGWKAGSTYGPPSMGR